MTPLHRLLSFDLGRNVLSFCFLASAEPILCPLPEVGEVSSHHFLFSVFVYSWHLVGDQLFGRLSSVLAVVFIFLPPCMASNGLMLVAECGVALYISANWWAALVKFSPSRLAAWRASFMDLLNLSTIPLALGHSGVTCTGS